MKIHINGTVDIDHEDLFEEKFFGMLETNGYQFTGTTDTSPMIYAIFIPGEGFIDTYNIPEKRYKTTWNLKQLGFDETATGERHVAELFGGYVVAFREDDLFPEGDR